MIQRRWVSMLALGVLSVSSMAFAGNQVDRDILQFTRHAIVNCTMFGQMLGGFELGDENVDLSEYSYITGTGIPNYLIAKDGRSADLVNIEEKEVLDRNVIKLNFDLRGKDSVENQSSIRLIRLDNQKLALRLSMKIVRADGRVLQATSEKVFSDSFLSNLRHPPKDGAHFEFKTLPIKGLVPANFNQLKKSERMAIIKKLGLREFDFSSMDAKCEIDLAHEEHDLAVAE